MSTLDKLEKDLAKVFELHGLEKATDCTPENMASYCVTCLGALKSSVKMRDKEKSSKVREINL